VCSLFAKRRTQKAEEEVSLLSNLCSACYLSKEGAMASPAENRVAEAEAEIAKLSETEKADVSSESATIMYHCFVYHSV
jgi:hypothetical protein